MQNTSILVIDDEPAICAILSTYLRAEGYTVYTAHDGPGGLEKIWALQPSLVVLDVMLPGMDGIELCRRIQQDFDIYILMLTGRCEEIDKLIGLSVGADDYVTKPFSPRELVARVKTILRRSRVPGPRAPAGRSLERLILRFPGLVIDPGTYNVWREGEPVALTRREFEVLYLLAEQAGRVCHRNQILERVWGSSFAGVERVVDVHIKEIRRKIEPDPANPTLIQTMRGVGYRFAGERLD